MWTCLLCRWAGAGDTVCFEAEWATNVVAPMVATQVVAGGESDKADGASGGGYLQVPEGAGKPPQVGGEAVLEFAVDEAGEYRLWARTWWNNSCGNSVDVAVDDGKPFVLGQDGTYKRWHWVTCKPVKLKLEKGTHTLKLLNREDGIKVDQLLLSKDRQYVPVGIEAVTVRNPRTDVGAGKAE